MARTELRVEQIDSLGNVTGADILAGYKISKRDEDPASSIKYYGFVDTAGDWYILRETQTGNITVSEFARGVSNFDTNWTGRAGLTYVSFDTLF